MGMSYDEYWCKDYKLVESFIKRHDIIIDQETDSNFELVHYIREAAFELVSMVMKDPKKSSKVHKYPEKPLPRTRLGMLQDKRNKAIAREIEDNHNQRMMERMK